MKQARDEAESEIKAYRDQREAQFQEQMKAVSFYKLTKSLTKS